MIISGFLAQILTFLLLYAVYRFIQLMSAGEQLVRAKANSIDPSRRRWAVAFTPNAQGASV